MTIRQITAIWEGLIDPAWTRDLRNSHSSRILNILLLLLLLWGVAFAIQYRASNPQPDSADFLVLTLAGFLFLTYFLNRIGQFSAAVLLTLGLFITFTFISAWYQHGSGSTSLPVLYYLVIPILMS